MESLGRLARGCISVVFKKYPVISVLLNAVLAAALTRRKQKARSTCAVRASDGRKLAYAMGVSWQASLSIGLMCSMSLCEWARIVLLADPKSIPWIGDPQFSPSACAGMAVTSPHGFHSKRVFHRRWRRERVAGAAGRGRSAS